MELIELQRGTKVMKALKSTKKNLEAAYFVHISETSFPAIVDSLKAFYSSLAAPEESEIRKKALEILRRACNLVAERFKECAYESEFHEKQDQLCRALVDVKELCRDYDNPESWDWLNRAKRERDEASIFLAEFSARWDRVLDSSVFPWVCRQEDHAHILRLLKTLAYKLEKGQSTASPKLRKSYTRFVDKAQQTLILQFKSLLEVTPDCVREVVSSMTDIPLVEFVPCVSVFKDAALRKTKLRVVDQDNTIDGIFEILASRTGLSYNSARPRGLFLLVGQTGVGKSEIAKAVAQHWYGDASRLVEINASEFREHMSKREKRFRNCLTEAVRRRPYSVILLDRVNFADTRIKSFLEDLHNEHGPTDIEGHSFDFSKSIIFISSLRVTGGSKTGCACLNKNPQIMEEFKRDPVGFVRTHDCSPMSSKTAIDAAKRALGAELFDSRVDTTFLMNPLHNKKAVCRLLLRDIVREVYRGRCLLHISDAALNVVLWNSREMLSKSTSGKVLKEILGAEVRPSLAAARDYNNAVVYVDVLVGSGELSFRIKTDNRSLADCYFKQKDGTFGGVLANLRIKLQPAFKFFEFRKQMIQMIRLKGSLYQDFMFGRYLLYICKYLSSFSPLVISSPKPPAREEGTTEDKIKFMNTGMALLKRADEGFVKATRVIIDGLAKMIDAPLGSLVNVRCYLFLCLHDDAKRELSACLTESLTSCSGKSHFTYVQLKNKRRGHEIKRLLIKKVKETPYAVFMFDGVEYADDVLYNGLLEILDEGTLDDGEGFAIDFRKAIIIFTSDAANRHAITEYFDCQPLDKEMNQNLKRDWNELLPWVEKIQGSDTNLRKHQMRARVEIIHRCVKEVKRFRTELLHRVGEIILLDPTLSESGDIHRLSKCNANFMTCSADAVSSSVLVRMFQCCDRDDAFFDWLKDSPTRFHLSKNVGDIC